MLGISLWGSFRVSSLELPSWQQSLTDGDSRMGVIGEALANIIGFVFLGVFYTGLAVIAVYALFNAVVCTVVILHEMKTMALNLFRR